MSARPVRIGALAGIAALAIGLGACGGDDETTSSTTSTGATGATGSTGSTGSAGSGEDFTQEANRICTEGNRELQADFADIGAQPSAQQIADVIVPAVQSQIDKIRELDPPAEDEATVERALTMAEDQLDSIANDPSQLEDGADPFAGVNETLREAGLDACAG